LSAGRPVPRLCDKGLCSRGRWRGFAFGLATVLGLKPRGFFIPYRHAGDLGPAGARGSYSWLETLMATRRADFGRLLQSLAPLPMAPRHARWDQDWFPRLDAAVAYAMVRDRRPGRIIEVGSGHSTRFMAEAIADAGLRTTLTAIDPAPRAGIGATGARAIRAVVPACGETHFAELGAGDILFIDSSHVLMPGSDVDFLVNRILPRLPSGALVHFHDVFLPDDYPAEWAWRGYNEQLAVAALLAGGGWRVLFAGHFAATRMAEEVAASAAGAMPLLTGAKESSLWVERVG
jgi:predicted O-methyltransferase YrrM